MPNRSYIPKGAQQKIVDTRAEWIEFIQSINKEYRWVSLSMNDPHYAVIHYWAKVK